jgi:glycosyltransferase involved in cell wall biosynthesis
MRVLVDDSAAFNQGAGIGRYARHLVPAAAARLPGSHFRLCYAPARRGEAPFADQAFAAFGDQTRVDVRRLWLSRRRADQLWFRVRLPLPLQLLAGRADVVYSPDYTAPPAMGVPRVITVHDLAYLMVPERAPAPLRRYLEAVVPRMMAQAARIVIVSETTRRDIEERYPMHRDKLVVVPNGVERRFFDAIPPGQELRRKLSLPDAYLLSVGTIEPRKNLVNLFAALRARPRLGVPLVVAGRRGWDAEPIYLAAADLERAGLVQFLGHVPDDSLPSLYAGAAALIYPSWYEGFGLPVLEAMAAGVPVVASTAPALTEVGGELITSVAPDQVEAMATAIERAMSLSEQAAPARQARQMRAAAWTWERSGSLLADVLRQLAPSSDDELLVKDNDALPDQATR